MIRGSIKLEVSGDFAYLLGIDEGNHERSDNSHVQIF